MAKVLHIILKVILTLLLVNPLFGVLGIFPAPTRELYNTDAAFNFIMLIMNDASYIVYLIAIVFLVSAILLWARREALAAILILPIMVNIVCFHLFLDGGLFTAGAILANILLVLDIYFIWKNKSQYSSLIRKK